MVSRSELGQAAMELAAAGHPVLPLHSPEGGRCSCGNRRCSRVGKHPRGVYGLRHASTDPEQVEAWWYGQPEANVGLRCDGLVAFDLDGPDGRRSLAQLEEDLGELPETWRQSTGRGEHRFFSIPLGSSVGNSTSPLGNPGGLDLRGGDRGYVVAAPSRHANGSTYRRGGPELPAHLPQVWLEQLAPPKPIESATLALADYAAMTSAYGRAALQRELAALARVEPGRRNNALNRAVYSLAGWVSGGELDWYELHDSAWGIGLALGLQLDEVERTIASAMNAGYARPRARSPRVGSGSASRGS